MSESLVAGVVGTFSSAGCFQMEMKLIHVDETFTIVPAIAVAPTAFSLGTNGVFALTHALTGANFWSDAIFKVLVAQSFGCVTGKSLSAILAQARFALPPITSIGENSWKRSSIHP